MNMKSLRDEEYARKNWTNFRPFYCRLSPEFYWTEVRRQIVEELNEEIQRNASHDWEYATYFTYPTEEQMESIHEDGLFFSEIREIVGYRSAEALALLAGLIRLEPEGDALDLLEESFANLWNSFSQHLYGHGYDTSSTRSALVLMLASNNVFGLVQNDSWINSMRHYFLTQKHEWSGKPLRELADDVLRVLGETSVVNKTGEDNPIITGVFDLDSDENTLEFLSKALTWEQGRPEQFDSAPPPSIFYTLPYHLVRFTSASRLQSIAEEARDPFAKTTVHFLTSLCLRSQIVENMGIGRPFTLAQATEACGGESYAASMTLGQMIKVGLVEFNKFAPWFHESQEFRCKEEARPIMD